MKWRVLRVGGQRITIHIVRDKHPKLEGANGMYYPDACTVYLARSLVGTDAFEDTLFHELDHVVNEVSGVNNLVAGAVPESLRHDFEEKTVRARTPIWHALLKDMGFKFPKVSNNG